MTEGLVQRLRTCSAEERRDVAIELAKTGTNDAVDELVRMINEEAKDYTARTIKTFWLKLPIRYSFEDQLIGIEALGETQNPRALAHLKSIYTPTMEIEGFGVESLYDSPAKEVYYYLNAKGELANKLYYKIILATYSLSSNECYYLPREDEEIDRDRIEIPKQMEVHKIIQIAIQKLEKTVQNA